MYPLVEREPRHPDTYVAWKDGVTRANLESCQAEIDRYLVKHREKARSGGGSVSGGGGGAFKVPALVAHRF